VVEIQAFGASAGGEKVQWLVADHLGTPRIVLDQSGSLANVKRHDYLPFGEELFAGTGGRTIAQGYSADGVRQQFTAKERDVETGLDYFLARYYSSVQGRFLSPDEFTGGPDELYDFTTDASDNPTFYADLTNPQSLNKYQYSYNNPLRYIDPDGHEADESELQQQQSRPAPPAPPNPYGFQPGDPERQKEKLDGYEAQYQCQQGDCSRANKMIPPISIPPLDPIPPAIQLNTDAELAKKNRRKAAARPQPQRRPRSTRRIGKRIRFNTKKEAEEAARIAGGGNAPVNHPNGKPWPHFHPGDGHGKPLNHDHYFYPKRRGTPQKPKRPPGKYKDDKEKMLSSILFVVPDQLQG
jgi:RHS repeat-associated protein